MVPKSLNTQPRKYSILLPLLLLLFATFLAQSFNDVPPRLLLLFASGPASSSHYVASLAFAMWARPSSEFPWSCLFCFCCLRQAIGLPSCCFSCFCHFRQAQLRVSMVLPLLLLLFAPGPTPSSHYVAPLTSAICARPSPKFPLCSPFLFFKANQQLANMWLKACTQDSRVET